MNYKPIIIINGEPNSIFLEIFFKVFKKKYKSPIILISSLKLLNFYKKRFNFKKKINIISHKKISKKKLNNSSINLINIDLDFKNKVKKISFSSNKFIEKSFTIGLDIIKSGITHKFINGPISKKTFLNKNCNVNDYLLIQRMFLKIV